MSNRLDRLYKLGGLSFIASGGLFLTKSALELITGPPPSDGAEILAWVAKHKVVLAVTNEVLFFAFMSLVPAVFALYRSLVIAHRNKAIVGCGIVAVSIALLGMLAIVHGRLVFPGYQMQVHTPDVAEFVAATYYGGLHAVAELFGAATFVLSLAMRRSAFGTRVAYLGFATAAFDFFGAFPWATGPTLALVSGVFFGAWFVAVGFRLRTLASTAREHRARSRHVEPLADAISAPS
jgi:hypothetical protein